MQICKFCYAKWQSGPTAFCPITHFRCASGHVRSPASSSSGPARSKSAEEPYLIIRGYWSVPMTFPLSAGISMLLCASPMAPRGQLLPGRRFGTGIQCDFETCPRYWTVFQAQAVGDPITPTLDFEPASCKGVFSDQSMSFVFVAGQIKIRPIYWTRVRRRLILRADFYRVGWPFVRVADTRTIQIRAVSRKVW